ncbi:MAG: hypothetical protein WC928_03030 [Patescibacteria group bacterium]|jgi:hypothetical protein
MKKLKEYWIIMLIFLCLVGGWFYWFELRPTNIRIACGYKTAEWNNKSETFIEIEAVRMYLDLCLIKSGLNK